MDDTAPFSTTQILTGSEALQQARANGYRTMTKWADGFDGFGHAAHQPRFRFDATARLFTIGSCFARNVEHHLLRRGFKLLSQVPPLPGDHYELGGVERTGYQNVYTPGSILEGMRLAQTDQPDHSIVDDGVQGFDLLTSGLVALPLAKTRQIRADLVQTYRRLREADFVVITLGYNESWRYQPTGAYINRAPNVPALRRRIDDFAFEILDYVDSRRLVREALLSLWSIAPRCRVILTVSPVPLGSTFSSRDIVVANQQSKSTLLAVATSLRDEFDAVDYFPSYEIVINSDRSKVFAEDGVHVTNDVVARVMTAFFSAYLGG